MTCYCLLHISSIHERAKVGVGHEVQDPGLLGGVFRDLHHALRVYLVAERDSQLLRHQAC